MAFVQGMIINLTTEMATACQFAVANSLIIILVYHPTSFELHIWTISNTLLFKSEYGFLHDRK